MDGNKNVWQLGQEYKSDNGDELYYAGYITNGISIFGIDSEADAKALCAILRTRQADAEVMLNRIAELEATIAKWELIGERLEVDLSDLEGE